MWIVETKNATKPILAWLQKAQGEIADQKRIAEQERLAAIAEQNRLAA